jgi:hypothetical protein
MATAHQIRDLITQTTSGTLRHRVPREVRDEVCRYAVRRRKAGAAWSLIARERIGQRARFRITSEYGCYASAKIAMPHTEATKIARALPAAGPRRELTERPISDVPRRTQPELPIPEVESYRPNLDKRFRDFDAEDLGILRFRVVARKGGEVEDVVW